MTSSSREQALVDALTEAVEGVESALAMVEQRDYIPDWDWLRGIRYRARHILTERQPDQAPPKEGSLADRVAWAILGALHENVPEADRPMSWSDMDGDQEKRVRSAAMAAIETVFSPNPAPDQAPPPGDVGELVKDIRMTACRMDTDDHFGAFAANIRKAATALAHLSRELAACNGALKNSGHVVDLLNQDAREAERKEEEPSLAVQKALTHFYRTRAELVEEKCAALSHERESGDVTVDKLLENFVHDPSHHDDLVQFGHIVRRAFSREHEKMRKVLEPFARAAGQYDDEPGVEILAHARLWQLSTRLHATQLTVGDLRNARAAFNSSPTPVGRNATIESLHDEPSRDLFKIFASPPDSGDHQSREIETLRAALTSTIPWLRGYSYTLSCSGACKNKYYVFSLGFPGQPKVFDTPEALCKYVSELKNDPDGRGLGGFVAIFGTELEFEPVEAPTWRIKEPRK